MSLINLYLFLINKRHEGNDAWQLSWKIAYVVVIMIKTEKFSLQSLVTVCENKYNYLAIMHKLIYIKYFSFSKDV